jgi:hypothetical protein
MQLQIDKSKIKKGMKIKLDCEFCQGPVLGNPYVFKFANYERFFCCTGCMSGYKKKYAGRIDSIKRSSIYPTYILLDFKPSLTITLLSSEMTIVPVPHLPTIRYR